MQMVPSMFTHCSAILEMMEQLGTLAQPSWRWNVGVVMSHAITNDFPNAEGAKHDHRDYRRRFTPSRFETSISLATIKRQPLVDLFHCPRQSARSRRRVLLIR